MAGRRSSKSRSRGRSRRNPDWYGSYAVASPSTIKYLGKEVRRLKRKKRKSAYDRACIAEYTRSLKSVPKRDRLHWGGKLTNPRYDGTPTRAEKKAMRRAARKSGKGSRRGLYAAVGRQHGLSIDSRGYIRRDSTRSKEWPIGRPI